jgi:hypothetical protein
MEEKKRKRKTSHTSSRVVAKNDGVGSETFFLPAHNYICQVPGGKRLLALSLASLAHLIYDNSNFKLYVCEIQSLPIWESFVISFCYVKKLRKERFVTPKSIWVRHDAL